MLGSSRSQLRSLGMGVTLAVELGMVETGPWVPLSKHGNSGPWELLPKTPYPAPSGQEQPGLSLRPPGALKQAFPWLRSWGDGGAPAPEGRGWGLAGWLTCWGHVCGEWQGPPAMPAQGPDALDQSSYVCAPAVCCVSVRVGEAWVWRHSSSVPGKAPILSPLSLCPPSPPFWDFLAEKIQDETGFSGLAQLYAGFLPPSWNQPQPPTPHPEVERKLGTRQLAGAQEFLTGSSLPPGIALGSLGPFP